MVAVLAALGSIVVGAVVGGASGAMAISAREREESGVVVGGDDVVSISREELEGLAKARGRALTYKDRSAFLAALDQNNADLLKSQGQLFDNLQKLPLKETDFTSLGQQGRTSDRFGRGVRASYDVGFVHQLDGFDVLPVIEGYRWTVTKAGKYADLVITAVGGAPASSMASSQTLSYPAPWDKWPDMQIVRTGHVMTLVDQPMVAKAQQYSAAAEAAMAADLQLWQAGGQSGTIIENIVMSLVPNKDELGTLYMMAKGKVREAGHSLPLSAFVEDRKSGDPQPAGGARIVIDTSSGFFTENRADGPSEVFRHEFAHAMLQSLEDLKSYSSVSDETWITEGIAEYIAYHDRPGDSPRVPNARNVIHSGKFNDRIPSGSSGWGENQSAETISFNYYLGHQALRYMAAQYGEPKTFAFVCSYYQKHDQKLAFQTVLNTDRTTFEQGWAKFVREQTG